MFVESVCAYAKAESKSGCRRIGVSRVRNHRLKKLRANVKTRPRKYETAQKEPTIVHTASAHRSNLRRVSSTGANRINQGRRDVPPKRCLSVRLTRFCDVMFIPLASPTLSRQVRHHCSPIHPSGQQLIHLIINPPVHPFNNSFMHPSP